MLFKAILCVSLSALPIIITYFIKQRHRKRLKTILQFIKKREDAFYYHCIFFSVNENASCKQHVFDGVDCGETCSYSHLQTVLKFIASAQYSISMCMYHMTLRQITDELINARDRGVRVRLITDNVTSQMESSKMKFLKQKFGFDIKVSQTDGIYMHHKFCLIDEKEPASAKLLLGSLNLTLQGFLENFEFVVLTNNQFMVQRFSEEFDHLWDRFKEVLFCKRRKP